MKKIIILIIILVIFGSAIGSDLLVHRKINFTSVSRTAKAPILDGKLDDPCWKQAIVLKDFVLTAGDDGSPPKYSTQCYVLYDKTHLYVGFHCSEPDVSNLKSTSLQFDDLDILYDDRVEVFLDVNHDHRSYFEFAINPAGVMFDQTGYNRLNGSKTCDMEPRWNGRWRAKTSVDEEGWFAEFQIDVTSLGLKQLEDGMTWGANFARARKPHVNRGDEVFKKLPEGEAEYSAWAPVNDYIRETISNFHEPIEFGDMVFGDPGFSINEISFMSALYAFGPLGYPSEYGWNPLHVQYDVDKKRDVLLRLTVEPESVDSWESTQKITLESGGTINARYWIPEMLENKIVAQILDPKTKKQLYRTSYTELTAPFIEFNLEPLYTRKPSSVEPLQYRMLMDEETRSRTSIHMEFKSQNSDNVITSADITDLNKAGTFHPVFDIQKLRALPGGNYNINCILNNKDNGEEMARFGQNLTKFDLEFPEKFEVTEGQYSYGGITDHGVRVRYPFGTEFVFWAKASYIPFWDVDQAAMTNEFVENWGGGNQGCCEPMQDRENRYITVEILENSPARAVVHWRYALSDPHYQIYFNEWVDEYYMFYPDGVGVREVNLWANVSTRHESFEVLLAKPPGVQTEQLFDEKFATLTNLQGKGYSNKYLNKNRGFHRDFVAEHKEFVVEVHFKDRMHPFTVFSLRDDLLPGVTPDHVAVCARDIGHADRRGHWPASRYQIDGYNTPGLDVPHHGNIGNIQAEVDAKNQPTTWTYLIGIQDEGSEKANKHAHSWLYPGTMKITSTKTKYEGYDVSQRAHIIRMEKGAKRCDLQFLSEKKNLTNPVFVIKHSDRQIKEVSMAGKKLVTDDYKIGQSKNGDTVLFVDRDLEDGTKLSILFAKK